MITVCHPVDDLEQAFLVAALEAEEIPFFIAGQYFGGLYPGIQIPWYNERSIRVPPSCYAAALAIVAEVRANYVGPAEQVAVKSKIRMIFEGVVLGWVMPGGTKKPSTADDD